MQAALFSGLFHCPVLIACNGGRRPGPFYHTGLKDANQAFPLSSVYGGRRPGPFYHAGLKDAKTRREKAWSILSHVMSMLT